jgi:nucleotide-binding universal stress UspA family protein
MLPNRVFVVPRDAGRDMESTMFVAAVLAARHDAAVDLLEIGKRRGPSYRDGGARQETFDAQPAIAAARDASRVRTVVQAGDAIDVIHGHAQAVDAALIIVGRNFGTSRFRRGSRFVSRLARSARVPVLVVPPEIRVSETSLSFREIVAAVDETVASAVVIRTILAMTRHNSARMSLVHAIATPRHLIFSGGQAKEIARDAEGAAAAAAERMERAIPSDGRLQVIARVIPGRPHRAILRVAAETKADLIVMGVPPRSRLDEVLFGSTLRGVLRRSRIPVLVLPVLPGARAWVDRTIGPAEASDGRASGHTAERVTPIDRVSEASAESFPASDPPAWSSLRIGPPKDG